MKVVFRVDASLRIGSGHVMRCLTLADALTVQGATCSFLCRPHPGHLIDVIQARGYHVDVLPPPVPPTAPGSAGEAPAPATPAHASWLGASPEDDAADCLRLLRALRPLRAPPSGSGSRSPSLPDWLVVDHYALDQRWEAALRPHVRHLMVLDDLADRPHVCDLLLDQTWGRDPAAYAPWVPEGATVLCGSRYALLRPEFAALRPESLARRQAPHVSSGGTPPGVRHVLVNLGGVDRDNHTGVVLDALKDRAPADAAPVAAPGPLAPDARITVVMGTTAPAYTDVRRQAATLPWPTTVYTGLDAQAMAQVMADSDLAIGAAGTTSWERCCLGLPTALLVLADNQREVARRLEAGGAARVLSPGIALPTRLRGMLRDMLPELPAMSRAAAALVDGEGTDRVVRAMAAHADRTGNTGHAGHAARSGRGKETP